MLARLRNHQTQAPSPGIVSARDLRYGLDVTYRHRWSGLCSHVLSLRVEVALGIPSPLLVPRIPVVDRDARGSLVDIDIDDSMLADRSDEDGKLLGTTGTPLELPLRMELLEDLDGDVQNVDLPYVATAAAVWHAPV